MSNKKLIYHNRKNGTAEFELSIGKTILYLTLENVHKKPIVKSLHRKVKA